MHAEPPREPSREAAPGRDHEPAGSPAAHDPEITAARPATSLTSRREQPRRRERILFGESDDLLADVDTGVNENEFKW